jgi:hypothetical protein
MAGQFVGFYWTLPVNWAGFRDLPVDVTAAAKASQTIRYQRECVRRYVADQHGELVDEIAFMDVRTDRATEIVEAELKQRASQYAGKATLLSVAFDEHHRWRHNPYLRAAAESIGIELLPLPPEPIELDGRRFDPIAHFKKWRSRDVEEKNHLRYEAFHGLTEAMQRIPAKRGRWAEIASALNTQGIKSIQGNVWTAEGVRKLATRMTAP